MDWSYITKDRAKDNTNELALRVVNKILESDHDNKDSEIRGAMMLANEIINSLEPEDEQG